MQLKFSDAVVDMNKVVEEEGEDGEKKKEEVSACQHFLVDTETVNGRHKLFNFEMSKIDTTIINEKLEEVLNKLNSTCAKLLLNVDISTPMKTILCLKNLICSVLKKTC